MLHAILQSTNTIVMAVSRVEGGAGRGGGAVMEGENREQAIRAMVDSAFRNCDITGTGKLLPLVYTVHVVQCARSQPLHQQKSLVNMVQCIYIVYIHCIHTLYTH